MAHELFGIELAGHGALDALFDTPQNSARSSAILLAHGSGVDIEHPWMSAIARELVARGFEVLRFRYPYMQRAQREHKPMPPDRAPVLEAAHEAALEELKRRCPERRWLLAGKSMGGRMSTHIAAKGADCAGLIALGYPLHPPRRPEQDRSEHFAALAQPALFVQGTRDEFATIDELSHALRRYGGHATLSILEGGDHSFALRASARRNLDQVLADVAGRIDAWERATWPE